MTINYDVNGLVSNASNLSGVSNPPYLLSDFYKAFPQFEGKIDAEIIQMYIDFANSCLESKRWGTAWKLGMSYFIAHFCTVHLEGSLTPESTLGQILTASQARGLISSKSAGDVSLSYDFSYIMQGLEGWVQWKTTKYGIQYAGLAKIIGKGAMYVW